MPWPRADRLATLAMMSRVALGHTGRDVRPPASVAPALLLLTGALTARVFLPGRADPLRVGRGSGTACGCAFALFAFTYTPILLGPRIDGQDG